MWVSGLFGMYEEERIAPPSDRVRMCPARIRRNLLQLTENVSPTPSDPISSIMFKEAYTRTRRWVFNFCKLIFCNGMPQQQESRNFYMDRIVIPTEKLHRVQKNLQAM